MSGAGPDSRALAVLEQAPAAVVSDALDRMGRRDRVLDPAIRALFPEVWCRYRVL